MKWRLLHCDCGHLALFHGKTAHGNPTCWLCGHWLTRSDSTD